MVELDAERWLDTKAAAALCGLHVETFRRLEREGKAPRPEFHPTPRKRFWRLGTLMGWHLTHNAALTGPQRPEQEQET